MSLHLVKYVSLIIFFSFSLNAKADTIPGKRGVWHNIISFASKTLKKFSEVDTNYVEPQHYDFTFMLQNTNTYESYKLNNEKGQTIILAPKPSIKVGPYFGWKGIFLGYTFDLKTLAADNLKNEFDLSIYSSKIGLDLFYRKTGNNYEIRSLFLGNGINTSSISGSKFDGFNSDIKGFNLYYIFNNKKFSYPAAFSQSTVQRRSAGSPLIGFGYTKHSLDIDLLSLNQLVNNKLEPRATDEPQSDSSLVFGNFQYSDYFISGGYAYNWVFAHNWIFASSLSVGFGYKNTIGNFFNKDEKVNGFNLKNFDIDAIGRFGIVWNNTKWYAGASAIFHSYKYNKNQFSTNTLFGNLNIYVGVNFGRKK